MRSQIIDRGHPAAAARSAPAAGPGPLRPARPLARAHTAGSFALTTLLALAAAAQLPSKPVTLVPDFAPGAVLTYSIAIHSEIGTRVQMDTSAEIAMHILAGATPGNFDAELRFTKYSTTVKADNATDRQSVAAQAAATDHTAQSMPAVRFRVDGQQFTTVSRPQGANYDQSVQMLAELARMDTLPTGPTTVGARWTRVRTQQIPTLNFSLPLTLECQLTAVGMLDGHLSATVVVHSHGSSQLPPGSLPGTQQMAAQGLIPEATVGFDTTATSRYRLPQTVLELATSTTHNSMNVRFIGPSPQAQTNNTDIDSTATVKLVGITPGR